MTLSEEDDIISGVQIPFSDFSWNWISRLNKTNNRYPQNFWEAKMASVISAHHPWTVNWSKRMGLAPSNTPQDMKIISLPLFYILSDSLARNNLFIFILYIITFPCNKIISLLIFIYRVSKKKDWSFFQQNYSQPHEERYFLEKYTIFCGHVPFLKINNFFTSVLYIIRFPCTQK